MRLFSTATIKQAKQKIESTAWAAAGWQAMQQRIAAWSSQSGQIPGEAGGWIHNYVCPEHWLPLTFDGNLSDKHRCPAGHFCTGEKYNAAWRVWRHRQITDLAREAGLLYVVQGLEQGREVAVSILTQYADLYTQFDGKTDANEGMLLGHAFNQALTEALWAVPLIHSYDLVAGSLDDELRERLIHDLWQPFASVMVQAQDILIAQNNVKSNYMAWLNVAMGCLGLTLNDQALIDRAIQPPAGFVTHLDQAILADGLEYEGTPYYHNFVLLANVILAEAAQANDLDLYGAAGSAGQTLMSMGAAFAGLVWPDGSHPDISEGSYWQDSIYDLEICQAYEILNGVQPNQAFAWTLHHAYERRGANRDNWAALLYGRDEVTTVAPTAPTHTVLEESGIALLRSTKALAALVSYGPYRKSHHQHDRLSLTVWPFSRDAGSPLYGLPARKGWYPHSYAHNTLVVDGHSHANCGGELLEWNGHRLITTAPEAYPGVEFKRTTEMKDDAILDEVAVQSDETHTFDWVFHLDGDIELPPNSQPLSGPLTEEGAGTYIELQAQSQVQESISFEINYHATLTQAVAGLPTEPRQARSETGLSGGLRKSYHSTIYRLTLTGEHPFTLLLGKAPGTSQHPQQQRQVLIGRTVGTEQRYQTMITQR